MSQRLVSILGACVVAGCSGSSPQTTSTSSGGWGGSGGATGGTTGFIDPGCGTVSEQGLCNGSIAEDCYPGDLDDGGTGIVIEDCATVISGSDALSCGTVSGNYLEFGVACLAGSANPCVFEDPTGQPVLVPCAGDAGIGCVLQDTPNGSTCEGGFDPCSFTDDGGVLFADGSTAPTCFFNYLLINCVYDQPTSIDCSTFRGSCSAGKCVGETGAACDDDLLTCASGLSCAAVDGGGGMEACK